MAKCSCPDAVCVINNFWKCSNPRCANGPDVVEPPPKRARRDTEPVNIRVVRWFDGKAWHDVLDADDDDFVF